MNVTQPARRRRRWPLLLALTPLCVIAIAGVAFPHMLRLITVRWSSLDELEPDVFVPADLDTQSRERYRELLGGARQRLLRLFPTRRSRPITLLFASRADAERYGGGPAGVTRNLKCWETYVVIAPSGLCVDVIAHEWCHAEIAGYLGWHYNQAIPTWFDEGVAMQCDDRETYASLAEPLTFAGLCVLDRPARFNTADYVLHYGSARVELATWIDRHGTAALRHLLEQLGAGEDFAALYRSVR